MNYQAPGNFLPQAPEDRGDIFKATLRRLHLALDPHNPAPDIRHARNIVTSLINLTHGKTDIPIYEAGDLYRSGRKHLILQALLRNSGNVCSKRELADLCRVSSNSTRVIKVYVCQIRAELAAHGLVDVIETVWGSGYMIRSRHAQQIRRLIQQQTMIDEATAIAAADQGEADAYN